MGVTVRIIRHAEKPRHGNGLAPSGQARAEAYAHYFRSFQSDGRPLPPDKLFAAAESKHRSRPVLTSEPLTRALDLPIDSRFPDHDPKQLVHWLRLNSRNGVVPVCWHHGALPALIDALGGRASDVLPKGKWPSHVYGWVVVMHLDRHGRVATSQLVEEHLTPDDRQDREAFYLVFTHS